MRRHRRPGAARSGLVRLGLRFLERRVTRLRSTRHDDRAAATRPSLNRRPHERHRRRVFLVAVRMADWPTVKGGFRSARTHERTIAPTAARAYCEFAYRYAGRR